MELRGELNLQLYLQYEAQLVCSCCYRSDAFPRAARTLLYEGAEGLKRNIQKVVTLLHASFHSRLSLELP